jgi:type VI secretion system protein ImpA
MTNDRKHASQTPMPAKATFRNSIKGTTPHDWMAPVDDAAPCGADLEYDPEFVVLSAKVGPKAEAQYGDFVGSPEPRCRTRLAGAAGLAEGTGLLAAWLAAFPNAIHPQPGVDVNRDWALEIRMNALQTLTDTDGLLADVREIALTKSTTTRLQLRDVERAFAHPRPGDALAPESVTRQLDDLRVQQPAAMEGFDYALASLEAIETWSREHLDVCAPDLSALIRLLRHLAGRESRDTLANGEERQPMLEPVPSINGAHDAGDPALGESPSACHAGAVDAASGAGRPRGATAVADRHAALDMIREARQWFETYEPSSPIPVLLKRAEQFVGKRYAEIAQAIPPDLLAQWDVQA